MRRGSVLSRVCLFVCFALDLNFEHLASFWYADTSSKYLLLSIIKVMGSR